MRRLKEYYVRRMRRLYKFSIALFYRSLLYKSDYYIIIKRARRLR